MRSWNDAQSNNDRGMSADLKIGLYIRSNSPLKSEGVYVFTGAGLCVCLSVTMITKKLWTDLNQILWEGS